MLMIIEEGRVVVWGWGEHGQLGLGDTLDRSSPQFVTISQSPGRVVKISCGGGHSFAMVEREDTDDE